MPTKYSIFQLFLTVIKSFMLQTAAPVFIPHYIKPFLNKSRNAVQYMIPFIIHMQIAKSIDKSILHILLFMSITNSYSQMSSFRIRALSLITYFRSGLK